ncbi:MAG: imidazole glycerol phosphate synthase subunit HisF [Nitrospira sp.]|nr:imidazole glycerol phosphate synthase subunit HisF [Nitrospira sp.]
MPIRIIPRLDIKGPSLVKGIHLEGLRALGRPEHFARHYYEQGADELLYMDIVASLYQRNSLLDIVRRTADEIFIPLTVGGGLRSLEDIQAALQAGADRVALNTAAVQRPALITEAATRFGSSTIVVSIEAIKQPDGRYAAYTDNGRQATGLDAVEWAVRAAELGAGELLITSVDREGTGRGFDVSLTSAIARRVSVPVIACGGAGTLDHVHAVLTEGQADAVCLGAILHYHVAKVLGAGGPDMVEGNTEFLRRPRSVGRIADTTLPTIKDFLQQRQVRCRPASTCAAGA